MLCKIPLKIIHSFNLVDTFYDLFRHTYMSPDCPVSHKKFNIETLLPFLILKVGVVHHCVVHRGMTVFLGWMDERELTKRMSFTTLLQQIYLLLNGY